MKPLKIACIGEAMIEIVAEEDTTHATLGVAGDSMNTAIYLKRSLGAEHDVSFVSMVGKDPLSNRIADFISQEGVSTRLLKRHSHKLPGIYSISTSDAGERSFSYWRDSSAARMMFSFPEGARFEDLDDFDVIFASAISLAILSQPVRDQFFNWIVTFRSNGGLFVFDSNFRPALWPDHDVARREVARAWSCCDIALPSLDDEMVLFGDDDEEAVLKRFRDYGVTCGVLKRGDLGPVQITATEPPLPSYPPAQKVTDTTAAGDSFNGAFLGTYLTTNDTAAAAKAGHILASHVVSHRGAIVPNTASH